MTAPTRHLLSRRLDLEWEHLRHHRGSLVRVRAWDLLPDGVVVADLGQIVDATQRSAGDAGDRLLGRLVEHARRDDLAGRIVIQRLLPGLIARSSRYWFSCDGNDPLDVAVPAAWIAITRFDPARRPRHVAAALISDTIDAAFKLPSRRISRVETVADLDDRPMTVHDDAFEELARVVAAARHLGVPREHLDLLRDLVRVGSPTQVAIDRGVTTRTVRNHRDRAVRRVREAIVV